MRKLHVAFASVASLLALPAVALAAEVPLAHHVCPNGLEVLVSESHATPLVTVEIAAHEGSMTEDVAYNGLSHLYEHMFFKGNAAQTDQLAFLARMRALGMSFNGTTWTERVNYFFTTTSDHFTDAMVFMRDAIVSPLFDAKELERERVVVTGEIDRNESEPSYHLWHTVEQKVFWKYPTRKDPLGTRATVLAATTGMMRTIQKRYYVPNNSILVVTGDVKAADVFAQADTIYTGWARAADPFVKFPIPKHPPIRKAEVVVLAQPVTNMSATVEWQGPSTQGDEAKGTYAADLLSMLVGDPASRFQKTLVDSGACVSAGMGYFTERHTGEISVSFEATPDNVDACTSAVFGELPRLEAPDYFTDAELSNAAYRVEIGRERERQTTSGRSHALTFAWAMATLDYDASYVDHVKALKRADLNRYLDTWVLKKPFVFGAMAAQKDIDAGLTKEHLEKLAGLGNGGAR
jgi:zinc protease